MNLLTSLWWVEFVDGYSLKLNLLCVGNIATLYIAKKGLSVTFTSASSFTGNKLYQSAHFKQ